MYVMALTVLLSIPIINYPTSDLGVDDFSQFSTQMEKKIYRILVKTFGVKNYEKSGCSICILNLAQAIIKENKSVDVSVSVSDTKLHNFKVRTLQKYMKMMQEAYVKRVIEIFHLRPEDLDMTPEYFCEIGFCHWKLLKVRKSQNQSFLNLHCPKSKLNYIFKVFCPTVCGSNKKTKHYLTHFGG